MLTRLLTGIRHRGITVTLGAGALVACLASPVQAQDDALIPSQDGMTVYDTAHQVTWLGDFNLPASNTFGLPVCDASGTEPCVNPSGSMSFRSAAAWVAAMNHARYLGRADWRLPTTPVTDPTCPKTGPHGNSFGFGCSHGALGSLYYDALHLAAPDTAVPIPDYVVGSFSNIQPYLYWSQSPGGNSPDGVATFSFNSGFQGANTADNFLYLLPMIPPGGVVGTPPPGTTVLDPTTGITWLADGNLAATNAFGLDPCTAPDVPVKCVNPQDGSMTWAAADEFVRRMNRFGHLGQTNWQLPPIDSSCPAYDCKGDKNPMGSLYYGASQLDLQPGMPVVQIADATVGPFRNVQPYLYWACQGESFEASCQPGGPAPNFEWSFSFGNGFLGTTLLSDYLYVTAYFPGSSNR